MYISKDFGIAYGKCIIAKYRYKYTTFSSENHRNSWNSETKFNITEWKIPL